MESNYTITVIAYFVGLASKDFNFDNKFIPLITGLVGGILGALFYIMQIPGAQSDIFSSIALGILSGLASTGFDQITKIPRR